MDRITQLLAANERYDGPARALDVRPKRGIVLVTCMDTRIDTLDALGLELGEVHVLRNAGARVTTDVLRSLAVSSHVLGTDTVVLMQHTQCGLTGVSDAELRATVGADLEFLTFNDHKAALQSDIDAIVQTPYLDTVRCIAGLVYDVDTGKVTELVRSDLA